MTHMLCITTILRYRLASVTHLGYLKSSRYIPEPKRRYPYRYPSRTFSRRHTTRSILSYSFHFQRGAPGFFFRLRFFSPPAASRQPQLPSLRPLGLPGSLRPEPHPTLSIVSGAAGVI